MEGENEERIGESKVMEEGEVRRTMWIQLKGRKFISLWYRVLVEVCDT